MINSRLISLIRKEFIQIYRDPRTLAIILIMPIMQLFLLGYAATNDVKNVSLAVFDQDRGSASRELLDAFRASDYFTISYAVNSEEEIRILIDEGDARVGIIIPPDYTDLIRGGGNVQVAIILDGSDSTVASTALSSAQLIAQNHSTKIMTERILRQGHTALLRSPLDVSTQVWYNPDLISAYYMIPGVIGMILYALTSILTANSIVRERERGTIEQLIVTPIRPWELIVGKLVPYIFLAYAMTIEVLALGHYVFDVPIRGNIILIMALSGLFLLTSLGIGLLASTFANTQQEAMLVVFMTLLPSIYLSGFFFPLEAMPDILQAISYLIPLRYFLVIIRSLMLKNGSVSALSFEIIALVVYGVLLMGIAVVRFRKRLD